MPLPSQKNTSWSDEDGPKISTGDVEISLAEITEVLSSHEQELVLEVLEIVEKTSKQGTSFVGVQAALYANRLAALRTNITMYSQYYKTAPKSDTNRKRKDILHAIYEAVQENINTLKLLSRESSSMGLN